MFTRYLGLAIALLGSSLLIVAALSAIKIAEQPNDNASSELEQVSDRLRGIEQTLGELYTTLPGELDQIKASYLHVRQELKALRDKVEAGGQPVLDPSFCTTSDDELRTIETWFESIVSRLEAQDGKLALLDADIAELSLWAREDPVHLAGMVRDSCAEFRQSLEALDTKHTGSSQALADSQLHMGRQLKRVEDLLGKLVVKVDELFDRLNELKRPHPRKIPDNGAAPPDCEFKSKRIIIRFDFNSERLAPEATDELDALAQGLSRCGEVRLRVEGHTDVTGSKSYNLSLSKRRIEAVTQYLVSRGISSKRLKPVSVGESDPAATNATLEGRAINRRVVLTLGR